MLSSGGVIYPHWRNSGVPVRVERELRLLKKNGDHYGSPFMKPSLKKIRGVFYGKFLMPKGIAVQVQEIAGKPVPEHWWYATLPHHEK